MLSRALSLSTTFVLALSAGATAQTVSSFVQDGGDIEAALLEEGSSPCPWLAEDQGKAPSGGTSLAASVSSLARCKLPMTCS